MPLPVRPIDLRRFAFSRTRSTIRARSDGREITGLHGNMIGDAIADGELFHKRLSEQVFV